MMHLKYLLFFTRFDNWLAFVGIGPLVAFVEKFVFNDWNYLKFLMVVVAIDFVTGVTKSWKAGKLITSKGWRDTVSKIIQYSAFLICTHVTTHFEVDGQRLMPFDWVNESAYIFLISIEIKSVYENIIGINSNLDFLKPIIQKFEQFLFNNHKNPQS